MANWYVNPLPDGAYELIDGSLLHLYPHLCDMDDGELTPKPLLIALTDDAYKEYAVKSNGYTKFVDGKFVYTAPKTDPAVLLANAKADKLSQLANAAQRYIDQAVQADIVPDFELKSWAIQGQEAKAWAADNAAPTPVLDQIAASRGVDAAKLKAAALRKTFAYEKLTAHIAGQRQALQSKIENAKTLAALEQIAIGFTPLPEAG